MLILLSVMFVLAALLPLLGLVRFVRSQYSEPEPLPEAMDGADAIIAIGERIAVEGRRDAWIDLTLIGVGLLIGAAASIMALPWPALWSS